jgi:hypothetical protein
MIIHKGGKASSFHNAVEGDSYDTSGSALYHVRGTNPSNTFACQVAETASSLTSEDCFVLVTPSTSYAWNGRGSNEEEKKDAAKIALVLANDYLGAGGRSVVTLVEGSEPDEFWEALGGRSEYPELGPGETVPREPRLFWATTAIGYFKVEEVDNFDQDDLVDDDVMILDTFTQVFVWIGSKATEEEKARGVEFATQYVETSADGSRRIEDVPIIQVKAGSEPAIFTCHFHGWDYDLAQTNLFHDPYEARLQALAADKAKREAEEAARRPSLKHVDPPVKTDLPPPVVQGSVTFGSSPTPPAAASASASASAPAASAGGKPGATKFPVPVAPAVVMAGAVKKAPETIQAATNFADPSQGYYSYDTLKGAFPGSVDPTKKEEYLEDAIFSQLFGVTKDAFRAQPKWKRDAKKKDLGLF